MSYLRNAKIFKKIVNNAKKRENMVLQISFGMI